MHPSLNSRVLELPLRHAWTIARGTSTSKRNVVVELRSGGHVGLGEAAPNVRYGESAESVLEALRTLVPVLERADPRYFREALRGGAGGHARQRRGEGGGGHRPA